MELKSTFSSACLEDLSDKIGEGSPKGLNLGAVVLKG